MEVPELGVQMELQLPAYTTGTAIPDPQPIEWGQGDQTHILMDTSHILNPRGTMGTPGISLNLKLFPFAFFHIYDLNWFSDLLWGERCILKGVPPNVIWKKKYAGYRFDVG